MRIINVESIKANGIYLGFKDGFGYLYQVGETLFSYTAKDGVKNISNN